MTRIEELEAELARLKNDPIETTGVTILEEKPPLRLDLGSGPRPKEGFHGVDVVSGVSRYCHDLCSGERWPFDDDSVDELHSSHFIEHIDAGYIMVDGVEHGADGLGRGVRRSVRGPDALLWFFDEAYRIAKPGAVFTIIWPALKSVRAFQDPTHRRFIPAEMIGYLSKAGREAMGVTHYGASCNWVGDVNFNIALNPDDQKQAESMALLSDMSDAKQAHVREQNRRYVEAWDRGAHDFIAVLKAVK